MVWYYLLLASGLDHRVGHFRPRRILAKVAERLDLSTVGCFCVVQKQRGVADAMIEALLPAHLPQDLCASGGTRALIRDGPGQSESVDPRSLARAAGRTAYPRRCSRPLP